MNRPASGEPPTPLPTSQQPPPGGSPEARTERSLSATGTNLLRGQLAAILRELGRREHGETTDTAGRQILTVPLTRQLPNPDPFTRAVAHVDPHAVRIMVNHSLIAAALRPADVAELIEYLGAVWTSGAWPMGYPDGE